MSRPVVPMRTVGGNAVFAPHPGLFLPALDVPSKKALFSELVDALAERGVAYHCRALLKALVEREAVGTSAVGFGIAIPHVRSMAVGATAMAFARPRHALDFGAPDGRPVEVVLLIVAPYGLTGALYPSLLRIAVALTNKEAGRQRLLEVQTFRDFETLLRQVLKPLVLDSLAR